MMHQAAYEFQMQLYGLNFQPAWEGGGVEDVSRVLLVAEVSYFSSDT